MDNAISGIGIGTDQVVPDMATIYSDVSETYSENIPVNVEPEEEEKAEGVEEAEKVVAETPKKMRRQKHTMQVPSIYAMICFLFICIIMLVAYDAIIALRAYIDEAGLRRKILEAKYARLITAVPLAPPIATK